MKTTIKNSKFSISTRDNVICYFEDGTPVVVKHFEYDGRLFDDEIWSGREPYYSPYLDYYSCKDEYAESFNHDNVVSPIYQIVKAERVLTQVLKFIGFKSNPVRKIIVAPCYHTIFNDPGLFVDQCQNLGVEIHQDLTALQCNDKDTSCGDNRLSFEWHKAVGITYNLYHTFRTINTTLICEIIRDLHGEFNSLDDYRDENPFAIEDIVD